MRKLAVVLYLINSISCIFIGSLHLLAHFQSLNGADIKTLLDQAIIVSGIESNIWNLWQGMSLMMGFLLIIIGLFNLLFLKRLSPNEYPPIGASVILIFMLSGVIYTGYFFFSNFQVIGGVAGIAIQTTVLVLSLRKA